MIQEKPETGWFPTAHDLSDPKGEHCICWVCVDMRCRKAKEQRHHEVGAMTRLERALAWTTALYLVGFTLNSIAFYIYGKMPAYYPEVPDGIVLDPRHVTGFSIIGDYISIGRWQFSPGDLALYAGIVLLPVLLIVYVWTDGAHRRICGWFCKLAGEKAS